MDFLNDVPKDRLPHALAVVGHALASREAAWALAGRLLCEKEGESACGRCGSCLRLKSRQHEGVLMVEPNKGVIKLEAATHIAEFLGLKRLTRARVILVEEAQSLNPQTTNAILKLVEEPPEATYFILLVADLSALLPTLRSRLQVVRRPALGREISSDESAGTAAAAEFMGGCLRRDRGAVAQWLETFEDRGAAERSCQALQKVLRDWSLHGQAAALDASVDYSTWPAFSATAKTKLWDEAFRMEQDIKAHVDRALAIENFFYQVAHELD